MGRASLPWNDNDMEVRPDVQELLEGLQQLSSSTSPGVCFKGGQDWEEKLGQVSLSQKLSYAHKLYLR